MEKEALSSLSAVLVVFVTLIFPRAVLGDPRDQLLLSICSTGKMQNSSSYVLNFVGAMEIIATQIQAQGYGVATQGQGPNAFHGLAQCYGDLNSTDCFLCYSAARNMISMCFPSKGATLFFDGCFMRGDTVNFFNEYTGPEDKAICGNRTRKNSAFQATARQAVVQAASHASNNNGYARALMPVSGGSNESAYAYVLANCWNTLNSSSCRLCLENASTALLRCLPWSEGRALHTGCFMRYSDINFMNQLPSNGSSKGTLTVVVAVIVSSTVFVAGGAVIGAFICKNRRTEKKRKGRHIRI